MTVYNFNGLSEWQHLNGLTGYEGNATIHSDNNSDMYGSNQNKRGSSVKGQRDQYISSPYNRQNGNSEFSKDFHDYLFRESQNVSHSDTILDMGMVEVDTKKDSARTPVLITTSRDGTVKMWR